MPQPAQEDLDPGKLVLVAAECWEFRGQLHQDVLRLAIGFLRFRKLTFLLGHLSQVAIADGKPATIVGHLGRLPDKAFSQGQRFGKGRL